jgi:hypothetical protein
VSARWLLAKTLGLAVPLYLATVVLGLIPTVVTWLGLGTLVGDRPWRADLLGPGWMNLAVEMLMEAAYTRVAPGMALVLVALALLAPLALFGQVVAYSFLAGGILEALAVGASRESFWAGCRQWFWPSFRLSLLGGVVFVMAGLGVAALSALARSFVGPDIGMVLQLAVQAVVVGWLELARAMMVVDDQRSVGRALARASRLAVRPLVLALWLVLSLPSTGLLLVAVLPPAVDDPYSAVGLVLALAFGQAVAFLGAWVKVVRLAVATRLALVARAHRASSSVASAPAVRAG